MPHRADDRVMFPTTWTSHLVGAPFDVDYEHVLVEVNVQLSAANSVLQAMRVRFKLGSKRRSILLGTT